MAAAQEVDGSSPDRKVSGSIHGCLHARSPLGNILTPSCSLMHSLEYECV